MMVFYRIKSSVTIPWDIESGPVLPDSISFLAGRIIAEALPNPLEFTINHPANQRPGHLMGNIIPIVSVDFLRALQQANVSNMQTFAAELFQPTTGEIHRGFVALNLIGMINAADQAASIGEVVMPGGPGGVPAIIDYSLLVLSSKKIMNAQAFRLLDNPVDIFISGNVMDKLRAMKPEGGWGLTSYKVDVR